MLNPLLEDMAPSICKFTEITNDDLPLFFKKASLSNIIENVNRPLFILNSLDDPFGII